MGQFHLTDAERETIATFVLGLVAEPPAAEYVCRREGTRGEPSPRAGRSSTSTPAASAIRWNWSGGSLTPAGDRRSSLVGGGRVNAGGKLVDDEDDEGRPLHYFTLWEPAAMDGKTWPVGGADVPVPAARIVAQRAAQGGALARLLYPVVLRRAREAGAAGAEAAVWGWLPPALVHEGQKVRSAWLREYLANPTAIRPAAVLRMPRFNFSDGEIDKLVAYFEAQGDGVDSRPTKTRPPAASPIGNEQDPRRMARLDAALGILADTKTFCGRCHCLGDNRPAGEAKTVSAPNLEEVGERIQPDYLRRWLANPRSILPYTAMPVNFPPAGPPLERDRELDTSRGQFEAVLDLLLHYDWYLRRRASIPG